MFKFWILYVFEPLFGGVIGTTYDVYLEFIEKRVADFPLVLIELFFARCSLRAKIDRKSAISLQRGHFDPIFHVEGVAPPIIFVRILSLIHI